MNKAIKNIFDKLSINFDDLDLSYFENADLVEQIKISKLKGKAYVHISINNFLPIRIIEQINYAFKKNDYVPMKLILDVKHQQIEKEIVWEYLEWIKNSKAQEKGGCWNFVDREGYTFDIDNQTIIFKLESLSQKAEFEVLTKYCDAKLKQCGFKNLNFSIEVDQSNEEEYWKKHEKNYQLIVEKKAQFEQSIRTNIETNRQVYQTNNRVFKKNFVKLDEPTYKSIADIDNDAQNVVIHGMVMTKEIRVSRAGRKIYILGITDHKSSIKATYFGKDESDCLFDSLTDEEAAADNAKEMKALRIEKGDWVALKGKTSYSQYDQEQVFYIDNFCKIEKNVEVRKDLAKNKRVELHIHSKMSAMDGISDFKDYANLANQWGWNALALTDHNNVQSFPDAYAAIKSINKKRDSNNQMKMIYGLEMTMLPNDLWYVKNPKNQSLRETKLVVYDLETTGLSPEFDEIIEFGAVVYNYKTGERKQIDILIKPEQKLKQFTKDLTHITDEMLEDKPPIAEAFKQIYEIIDGAILVAHNANFDFNFLNSYAQKLGYPELTNTVIDTLTIARAMYPGLKNHRLGTVAKKNGILYDEKVAHRGDYDADVLTDIYEHMWANMRKIMDINLDSDWAKIHPQNDKENMNYIKTRGFHTTVLVKNQAGLKKLYKLVSKSHTDNFFGGPKIFKNILIEARNEGNLLLGTSCVNGEIFEMARTNTLSELEKRIQDYDYVELQPLSVYKNLLQNDSLNEEELKRTIKIIIAAALKYHKIIVATSDAHYVNPELKQIREVYINAKGLGGTRHPLFDYKGRVKDNPDQHLRTTDEMLKEFAWLEDQELINKIVIENSNLISSMVEPNIEAVKEGLYTPSIENVNEKLRAKCYETAHELYGSDLPEIVEARLEKELNSITKYGFSVVYWISHLLVKKSLDDGYLVGSRGSVGSSFVATMSKITEVNPLKAHYRCETCQYSDFNTPAEVKCGYDLRPAQCPKCKSSLVGDGHDIPFETFLGFEGDKVPDIDLNFSGEYQPVAHNFTKEMFGENNVFRAGTISTVAEKTAFGYVKAYYEEKFGYENQPRKVEIERLASLAEGVKRTTGQHPGGIIILPSEYEIEDFTPINYPADDTSSSWKTTHFDFHSIHDNLLKMDILGHVDPTALRILRDITGVDPMTIPTNDKQVYSLFSGLSSLKIQPDQINGETTGAIGIPEFGTQFVRGMLKETSPKTFADLVQISGLSHGTDVWLGNARDLIKENKANISTVIGCRDDIMVYLMSMGLDSSMAFTIMESVRKGKGLKKPWIDAMKACNVPDWYIESCLKIKYMFPKAHATAYVLMAYRIAWYKIHYPAEYYATFLSTRADAFDLKVSLGGYEAVNNRLKELEARSAGSYGDKLTKKDEDLMVVYEIMLEMFSRGIKFGNIDFKVSQASRFVVVENPQTKEKTIIPPFNIIDSLGITVAESIVKAREISAIASVADLKNRTQVTQTQLKIFDELRITDSLSSDEQLTFEF
ncbi:PolC-type DNA polymerase III [Mesoplasma syrphidae]|uniref:DNA polymerase III PolC-type n=1 Tax=Mesoplasma syrphidae TaxID=225999 RepID=A0A2K9BJP2_9MOLU|nr:PolC-type DNA polymerase III [Mesoplasma syrphidae]AUF83496.1 PolC-type DNA polymerase III [Mesoplasma syrphidae]